MIGRFDDGPTPSPQDTTRALEYLRRQPHPGWVRFEQLRRDLFAGGSTWEHYGPAVAAVRELRLTGRIDHRINGELRARLNADD